jgi:energy-coupling factor transport system ATP-binding protein
MIETIIELKDVAFAYPKSHFQVCCQDFKLNTGEITLVTGKNGSGKTTLLKLCCGILRPDTGSLYIYGEDTQKWPLGRIGKSIGYLFQEPSHQLFTATVWDEMTFIGSILGKDCKTLQEKAVSLLQRFNLLDLMERSIYRLSRGEKQRLAIAAILMQEIHYLILDEPTTGLDGENRNALYDVIASLLHDGIGIAIISHDKEMISRYGERRITVENGRVV